MNRGRLFLQYEGMNPSGSFKDNGMTAAFTHAHLVGAKRAACASTGNTSASVAMYSAVDGRIPAVVLVGSGKIAYGKLAQALDYGVRVVQVQGDFDTCMKRVKEVAKELGIYLMNSLNPFRLEGQKTIMYRIIEALLWDLPEWVVVPGGNLGNSSAFGKAFKELQDVGLISRIPRMAVINAAGADTLYRIVNEERIAWNDGRVDDARIAAFYEQMDAENRRARTVASAIEINRPVNLKKCLRALEWTGGVVEKDFYFKTIHPESYWGAIKEEDKRPFVVDSFGPYDNDCMWELYPQETIDFMKTVKKPWIGYKVFAAGAVQPKEAFQFAFENGTDFACVGMFDFQVRDNVRTAKKILAKDEVKNRARRWA